MTEQAERLVAASPRQVRAVLLDPLRLPDWNPAFTSIAGPQDADTRHEYRITARGLPGSFAYEAIEPLTIRMTWRVPGFAEFSTWSMTPTGPSTSVRHTFVHSGPLASLLRRAYRGVADLRLDRLAHRLGMGSALPEP
jgi:uncharacterized protein YndB with AHSA1/START domain